MKKTLSKICGIAIITLSAMIFVHPVAAAGGDCSVDYPKYPITVTVDEGKTGRFKLKVECDTSDWEQFKTFSS